MIKQFEDFIDEGFKDSEFAATNDEHFSIELLKKYGSVTIDAENEHSVYHFIEVCKQEGLTPHGGAKYTDKNTHKKMQVIYTDKD